MAEINLTGKHQGFGHTNRKDAWWIKPLIIFIILSSFVIYATWAAFQGKHYYYGPYLSPLYSPELFGDSPHSWFGPKPGWWPAAYTLVACTLDIMGARLIPVDLLLLPGSLLQSHFGLILLPVLSLNHAKNIGVKILFR